MCLSTTRFMRAKKGEKHTTLIVRIRLWLLNSKCLICKLFIRGGMVAKYRQNLIITRKVGIFNPKEYE